VKRQSILSQYHVRNYTGLAETSVIPTPNYTGAVTRTPGSTHWKGREMRQNADKREKLSIDTLYSCIKKIIFQF